MSSDEIRRAEIYYRHQLWVFKFFLARGFSREEAEDLKQDTFVRVFANMGDLRSEQATTIWVQRVTATIWKNELRRVGAQKRSARLVSIDIPTADGESVLDLPDPRAAPPTLTIESEQDAAAVQEEIRALPEQMRRCLVGYEVRGLKYREIADELKIEINTVKSHIFQARRKLKERLEQRWKPMR